MSVHDLRASLHACYGDIVAGIVHSPFSSKNTIDEKAALILRQAVVHAEFGLRRGGADTARLILEGVRFLLHSFDWDEAFDDLSYADALALKAWLQGEVSLLGRVLGAGEPVLAETAVSALREAGSLAGLAGILSR